MFDNLRYKWRMERERDERKQAVYDTIKSGSEQQAKEAVAALRPQDMDSSDKGWALKLAIDRQNVDVFRSLMAHIDNPNHPITYTANSYSYTFSPIDYALNEMRTHDIALLLATDPRTEIKGKMLDDAKKNGMQGVASMLAKRIAEMRRVEAAQLDREAAGLQTPVAVASPPAILVEPANDSNLGAGESWALMSKTSIAHVTSSEAIGRKLTEIFNFESRERVMITENLKTGTENMGKPEAFDTIAEGSIKTAEAMLKQLNADAARKTFTI